MKKIRNRNLFLLCFILMSLLTTGCNGRITVSEAPTAARNPSDQTSAGAAQTAPPNEGGTAESPADGSAPAKPETGSTDAVGEESGAEQTAANESYPAPTAAAESSAGQPATEEIRATEPPQTPAPTIPAAEKQTPAPPQTSVPLLKVPGFVGSSQLSYNPYGCDPERAEELARKLESGELSLKYLFKDTLFVGDSIMVGFSDYKLVNSGNVIAGVGEMLNPHLGDNLQKIIDYNPEALFLHYGLNEMGEEAFFLDQFIADLRTDLKTLKEELPYTKIVVMALWPIKDSAVAKKARLARQPAYNEAIRKLCVELGVAYDERSELFAANPDLYQADGIHCVSQMYRIWATALIREMGLYD